MKIKHGIKKIVALVLSMVMYFTMVQNVLALNIQYGIEGGVLVDGTTEENAPKLSYDYMTYDTSTGTYVKTAKPNSTDIEIGDRFWIGIKALNFNQFTKMIKAANNDDNGLYSTTINLSFDSRYVRVEPDVYLPAEGEWPEEWDLTSAGLDSRMNALTNSYFAVGQYNFNMDSTTVKSVETGFPYVGDKTYTMVIQYSGASRTYTQALNDEYLMYVPVEIVDIPAAGTQVLGVALNPVDLVFSFTKSEADSYTYAYNSTTTHLEYYLNLETDDLNLFPPTYEVTYDANTGTFAGDATTTETVAQGGKLTLKDAGGNLISSAITPPDGKVFAGWNAAVDGNGTAVDENTVINKTNVPELDEDTGTLTLYAQYEDGYTVTFDANNGEWTDGDTTKVFTVANGETFLASTEEITDKVDEPSYTDAAGTTYEFAGWYLKDGDTFTVEATDTLQTETSGPITVYARWKYSDDTVTDYTLTFDKNSDAATEADPTEIKYNAGQTLADVLGGMPVEPTREDGYKFIGWYTNPAGDGAVLTVDSVLDTYLTDADGEVLDTVYARWGYVDDPGEPEGEPPVEPTPTATTVTVTFVTDGYDLDYKYAPFNDKYINYGESMFGMPADADITAPTGQFFKGWYTEVDGGGIQVTDGTIIGANVDTYIDETTGTKVLKLYPYLIDQLEVVFNANGGKWSDGEDEMVFPVTPGQPLLASGETIAAKLGETPVKTDYTLVGWYLKDENGTFTTEVTDAMLQAAINDPITAYAMWKHTNATTYTLKFDKNSDAATEPDPTQVGYNSKDTLESVLGGMPVEPARTDGYYFMGWYNNESGDGEKLELTTDIEEYMTVNGEVLDTVYARWGYVEEPVSEPPQLMDDTITVHIDLNGGTAYLFAPLNDKYIQYGATISDLPLPEHFTAPDGKVFDGWDTSANGDGTDIVENVTVFDDTLDATLSATTGGEITIFARWTDKVKVTFHANGGEWTPDGETEQVFEVEQGQAWLAAGEEISDKLTQNPERQDYVFIGWYLMEDGTFTQDPTATLRNPLTNHVDVYAMWDRDPLTNPEFKLNFDINYTGDAAVTLPAPESILFNTNDTVGELLGGMPVEPTRDDGYQFLGWYSNPAGDGAALEAATDLVGYTGVTSPDNTEATVYAKWGYVDEVDTIIVHVDLNGAAGYPYTPVNDRYVQYGKPVYGLPAAADITPPDGMAFAGWNTQADGEGTPVTEGVTPFDSTLDASLSTAGGEITIYAVWSSDVTLSFNENGGALTADSAATLNPITLPVGGSVSADATPNTLPVVEKDGYTFKGWFYEDAATGNLVEITADDPINTDLTVTAKWEGKLNVTVTETEFEYDGTGKTPIYDTNYKVGLTTDPLADLTASFPEAKFNIKYKAQGAADSDYTADKPVDAGIYEIDITLVDNPTILDGDKFTEYTLSAYHNTFTITAKVIDITIDKDYQYVSDPTTAEDLDITATDTTLSPMPNLDYTDPDSDIKVTFTKVDEDGTPSTDTDDIYENTKPTEYGRYEVTIEPADGSSFEIGTVTDSDSTTGKTYFYLIPTTREIIANYGDGTSVADPTQNEESYATVTFTTPSTVTDVDSVKTTLATGGDKTVLPAEGTDFNPPASKTIDYWETRDESGITIATFTELTDIPVSVENEPLTIYAVYKDAQWKVIFKDTKASAEADIKYTVQATMAIEDTEAVVAVDDVALDPSVDTIPSDVPAPAAAPENKMFIGWTTDASILTDADVTEAEYAGKMFTKASKPGDTLIPDGTAEVTVYAVYVTSNDATLKSAVFKKTAEDETAAGTYLPTGDALPFTESDWTAPSEAIVFISDKADEEPDTYYLVVDDFSVEKLYAAFEPTQPGSTIAVTVNTNDATEAADGTLTTITETIDSTTYNKDSDTNSYNTVEVTVTAPDATTTKTYVFNVLKYAEAKIVLNYGNSPYGMIMREADWTDDYKATAKTEFISGTDATKNTFKAGYVPTNGLINTRYTLNAWGGSEDSAVNLDRNDYAMFIYQRTDFKDSGYTAVDSMGRDVEATDVEREITFTRLNSRDLNDVASESETVTVSGEPSDYTFTEITSKEVSGGNYVKQLVRPGVYDMTYTFTDPNSGASVTAVRKIVVLMGIADTNMDIDINSGDLALINQTIRNGSIQVDDTNPADAKNLFVYRSVDTNLDGDINSGDLALINTTIRSGVKPEEIYKPIE